MIISNKTWYFKYTLATTEAKYLNKFSRDIFSERNLEIIQTCSSQRELCIYMHKAMLQQQRQQQQQQPL